MTLDARLQALVDRTLLKRKLGGIVVRLERGDGGESWTGAAGDLNAGTPFFLASTTKLYTTAIVLRLVAAGHLALDDRLRDRVDPSLVERLHVHKGIDHTARITIRHLLAHTSGLPDYFQGRGPDGLTLERALRDGRDRRWTLEDALGIARAIGGVFPPGTPGRAVYADTNYQLLGRIAEVASDRSYGELLEHEVFAPLGLGGTWLYTDPADRRPATLRDKGQPLSIPLAMTSFGPDGGLVATAADLMRFLSAFFEGRLFDRAMLEPLKVYHRIFFPLQYGVGFMRVKLPRLFTPFQAPPEFLGHSGLSGAFAFHATKEDVYMAGTTNELSQPDAAYRMILGLLAAMRSKG